MMNRTVLRFGSYCADELGRAKPKGECSHSAHHRFSSSDTILSAEIVIAHSTTTRRTGTRASRRLSADRIRPLQIPPRASSRQSIHIGHASSRGLVQSIFSPPPRRPPFELKNICTTAPRRRVCNPDGPVSTTNARALQQVAADRRARRGSRSIRRKLSDSYVPEKKPGSCEKVTLQRSPACCVCFEQVKPRCPHRLRPPARPFCISFSTTCGKSADYPRRRLCARRLSYQRA